MGWTETIVCEDCDGEYDLYAVECEVCETSFCRSCGHDCDEELERGAPCRCTDDGRHCQEISNIESNLINLYNAAMDSGDWSRFVEAKAKSEKHWRRWHSWNKKVEQMREEAA